MDILLHYIDLVGTFAFALSGAMLGIQKKYDIFGIFSLKAITAIGGGVLRDLCLSATPPSGLINEEYFFAIFLAFLLSILFQHIVFSLDKASLLFDALGLGFFAAFGANKTYAHTGSVQLSIIMGCMSAVGGGCLRDVLCGRTPIIFTKEIYASAAIIGAAIEVLGSSGVISSAYSIWIAIITCTLIRLISLYYGLNLPTIRLKSK